MNARSSGPTRAALLILGTLVVGSTFAAAIALGRDDHARIGAADPGSRPASTPVATTRPSVAPSVAPSLAPSVARSLAPTPAPSKPPRDAMPMTVDLETLTADHVHVDIVDSSGTLVSAISGTPTASAAVERLLAGADIEEAGPGKYRVVDPLYEEWIVKLDAGVEEDGD